MNSRVTISLIALALTGAAGFWMLDGWIDNGWATAVVLRHTWPLILIGGIPVGLVSWFFLDEAAEARASAKYRQRRQELDQAATRLEKKRQKLHQEYSTKLDEAQQLEDAARASWELSEREAAESRGAVRRMEKLLQQAERRRENATAGYARVHRKIQQSAS